MESATTGLIDITILSVGVGALDDPNIVGDDVLGVPFIKISLHFARTCNARPYRFNACPKIRLYGRILSSRVL